MYKPGRTKMPPMMDKPTMPSANKTTFEKFVDELEKGIFNKTFGNRDQVFDNNNFDNDSYDTDKDFYDYEQPTAIKTTQKDPYKDGADMSRDMKTYWDRLALGTTPLYDNDYDYNYKTASPYEAYDEYSVDLPNNAANKTFDGTEYMPSAYLPRPWMSYLPEPIDNSTFKETVTYSVSGYEIAHAVYIGAVVLILVANLIIILAILFQPRIRCRSSTILLLNFFVIEVLLSIVDLVFTQKLLIAEDRDKVNMGVALCLAGPWLLHIFQAAQPVALFILNVESITTILAPERFDVKVGCRVSAILVIVTWLFGVALASIFVTRSKLIETLVVVILCYDSLPMGTDDPITMNFLLGLLQLGGPIIVLLTSGVTLIVVVIRRTNSPQMSSDAKSRVRGNVIVLLAVSLTYVLVTLPVIIINARFVYFSNFPKATRAWITVQVIRRLGALFFPAFWWSRPDVRRSLKQLPSRVLCKVQDVPSRPSILSLENDTETADLLPLELADPQQQNQAAYRSV